jgi:hypothetical protein
MCGADAAARRSARVAANECLNFIASPLSRPIECSQTSAGEAAS